MVETKTPQDAIGYTYNQSKQQSNRDLSPAILVVYEKVSTRSQKVIFCSHRIEHEPILLHGSDLPDLGPGRLVRRIAFIWFPG